MLLLIDAGNTRIKWGVIRGEAWIGEGALAHAEVAALADIVARHPGLRRIVGTNVAGPAVAAAIAVALCGVGSAPQWIHASAERCGVRNRYDDPARLGADRWVALIGARALHRAACLVVNAGTATTVDILATSGDFDGGIILPGEDLMRRALAGNTAQLPFAEGRYVEAPRNTADAIVSGCRNAQAGAIERMFRQIAHLAGARCLLSGGAAPQLEELLGIPFSRVDNLVLKGLAVVAREDAAA